MMSPGAHHHQHTQYSTKDEKSHTALGSLASCSAPSRRGSVAKVSDTELTLPATPRDVVNAKAVGVDVQTFNLCALVLVSARRTTLILGANYGLCHVFA